MARDLVSHVGRGATSQESSDAGAPGVTGVHSGNAGRRLNGAQNTSTQIDAVQFEDEEDETPATSANDEPKKTEDLPADDPEAEKRRKIDELQKEIERKQQALDEALESGDRDKAARISDEIQGLQQELEDLIRPPVPEGGSGGATTPAPAVGGGAPGGFPGGGGAPVGGGFPAGAGFPGGSPGGGGFPGGGVPGGSGGGGAVPANHVGPDVPAGPPGSKVARFIDVAKAQQGDPYVFGAEGPDKFDCSGLVAYALKEAGTGIGRTTAAGYQEMFKNSAVGKDQLKPGDLVFFWSPNNRGIPPGKASHVEIYLGNGMTMGTDNPSEGARIEPINWDTFIGGARVPQLYE